MKLEVKYVKRDKLIPYANNARTHSEHQVKQIAASIKEFGFTNPILIDEDRGIIAGHGRLEAAEILDIKTIPTIQLCGLSDAQKRAYIIADNKLAMNAGWDAELLKIELTDLKIEDFDLEILGFSEAELSPYFYKVVDDLTGEWQGMPEFDHEDQLGWRTIKLHFTCQAEVDQFEEMIQQPITEKTKFIWFVRQEREQFVDKSVVSEVEE